MDNRQTAEQNSGKKAVKTIGLMAVIILLAKFMGLSRETLVANIYGQGMESDILNTPHRFRCCFLIWFSVRRFFRPLYRFLINICRRTAKLPL